MVQIKQSTPIFFKPPPFSRMADRLVRKNCSYYNRGDFVRVHPQTAFRTEYSAAAGYSVTARRFNREFLALGAFGRTGNRDLLSHFLEKSGASL